MGNVYGHGTLPYEGVDTIAGTVHVLPLIREATGSTRTVTFLIQLISTVLKPHRSWSYT